jgi:hypothetical protein
VVSFIGHQMDFEKMEQNGNLTRRKKGGLVTLPFIFGKLQNNFFLSYVWINDKIVTIT